MKQIGHTTRGGALVEFSREEYDALNDAIAAADGLTIDDNLATRNYLGVRTENTEHKNFASH